MKSLLGMSKRHRKVITISLLLSSICCVLVLALVTWAGNSRNSPNTNDEWSNYLEELRSCKDGNKISSAACTLNKKTQDTPDPEPSEVSTNVDETQESDAENFYCPTSAVNLYYITSVCLGVKETEDYWLGRSTVLKYINDGLITPLDYESARNSSAICRAVVAEFLDVFGANRSNQEFADFFLGCRTLVVERLAPYGTSLENG